MSRNLGANEIRVNKTCISISRNLYDMANATIGGRGFHALVQISSDRNRNAHISIRLYTELQYGSSTIDTMTSSNQVTINNYTALEEKEGSYECSVQGNSITGIRKI